MREAGDLRQGNVVKVGNDLLLVVKSIYNAGGRNAATVKMKLKNLASNAVTENVYRATDKFDNIMLDKKTMAYLYGSNDFYTFMDQNSFEQIDLTKEVLGDALNYIKEQMEIDIVFYGDKPVSIELPTNVDMEITYTEPATKGDTSGKVFKAATIETGFEVQVPLYCMIGEKIRIDTRNGEFVERVK